MSINTATKQEETILNDNSFQYHRWRHLLWSVWSATWKSLLALIVGIFILEGYFRLAGVGGQEFVQPDLKMGCRHIPGKQVIWRMEGYSDDRLSSAGLRDNEHTIAKPKGVYRIALLGDSAVESLQVGLNHTFGKVLENLLNAQLQKGWDENSDENQHKDLYAKPHENLHQSLYKDLPENSNKDWRENSKTNIQQFEVINFGCSSYSTGQELLQYEQEVDQYQPDAIVLLYNRGDSSENIVSAKDRKRAVARPYFYLDQTGQLKQDDSVLAAKQNTLRPNIIMEFLRRNSNIYGVLTQADFSLSLNEPRYNKLKNWWQALLNLPTRLTGKKEICSQGVYPDQDDMVVTKALLERLAQEAQDKKRTFILTVFPNTVNYDILKNQAKDLKELAAKKNFQYLDLSDSFLAGKNVSDNFLQYHFSEKGHALVAYDLFNIFCRNLVGSSDGVLFRFK